MIIKKSDEGKWIRLKGISGHGKNRIREHGDLWLIVFVDVNKVMLRSRNKTFKVRSVTGHEGEMHHDGRWIDNGIDKNFEIVEINC